MNGEELVQVLMKRFGCKTNQQLADFLGVAAATVGNWRNSDEITPNIVANIVENAAALNAAEQLTNSAFLCKLQEICAALHREQTPDDQLAQGEFANRCGQYPQNMANYLAGDPMPGDTVLRNCLRSLCFRNFSWTLLPIFEIEEIEEVLEELPESGGVYILYDGAPSALYVGRADNLKREVKQTLDRKDLMVSLRFGPSLANRNLLPRDYAKYLSAYGVDDDYQRHNIEALLLRILVNQLHNTNIGHFWSAID